MLMRAVQNYTGATSGPGRRSASTGRRRRRKRPRIQCDHSNEHSFKDVEPGSSGTSSRSEVNLSAFQSGRNVHAGVTQPSGHSSQLQLAPTHSHRTSSKEAADHTAVTTQQFQRTQRVADHLVPRTSVSANCSDSAGTVRQHTRSLMGNPPGLSRELAQGQWNRQPVDYSSNRHPDSRSHGSSSADYHDTHNRIMHRQPTCSNHEPISSFGRAQ